MFAKPIIVFIDDDADDLFLFREVVQETYSQHEAVLFADPEKALEYLEQTNQPIHCIICDVNMPKLDGFKLRSLLLKHGGSVCQVPFFILSTAKVDWQELLSKKLKVNGCYQKESSVEGVKHTLEMIFGSIEESY